MIRKLILGPIVCLPAMSLRTTLDRLLLVFVYLIPFAGLVTYDQAVYPYVTPKYLAFRALLFVAFSLWLGALWIDRRAWPRRSAILYSLVSFLAVVFVADVLGSNFSNSFWSNYSRMEGFFSLLMFLFYVLMLDSVLNTEARWRRYWWLQILGSALIFVVAVLQKMGLAEAVDHNRVDSVFGNSSYLAIYASMVFFLCLFLYPSFRSRWLRFFVGAAALCNLGSIYLSQTRSATIGVLVGLVFLVFALTKNKKKAVFISVAVFGAFALCIFLLRNRAGDSTNLFERLAQISPRDGSTQARIAIWEYCLRAIAHQPWLGWGQENYLYMSSFYQPNLWSTPWVDRSHNLMTEWLLNAGFFGLAGILALLFFLIRGIVQTQKLQKTEKRGLLSVLLCWGINQFLSIDFFSLSLLFYSVMAYAHSLTAQTRRHVQPTQPRVSAKMFIFLSVLTFGVWANYELNYKTFTINLRVRQAAKNETLFAEAVRPKPYRSDFENLTQESAAYETKEVRAFMIQSAYTLLAESRERKEFQDYTRYFYAITDEQIQKQLREDPQNLAFKHMAANFYGQFQNFPMAEMLFGDLLNRIPQQQYFLIDYGHVKLAEGRLDEGLNLYRKAYLLDLDFHLARMFYAIGLIYNHRFAEAHQMTDQLIKDKRYEAFDERLINSLLSVGENEWAAKLAQFKNHIDDQETH